MLLDVLTDKATGKRGMHPWVSPELIAEYHAQSLSFLVLRWMRTGMNVSVQEMADAYDYMIRHSIEDILKDI